MKLEQGEASFEASKWKKHCTYIVPWCLRGRGNDNDFRPHLVSIGPCHYEDPRLKDMQFHKERMLDCILKRTGKDISEFYDAIKHLEHEARACYEDLLETRFQAREDFMKMLVLDGCFMLDFLSGCYEGKDYCELGYKKEDPIFSKLYMCYGILMDMLLIENQIPLFILNQIYEVQFGYTHEDKKNPRKGDKVTDLMFEAFNHYWVIGRVPKSERDEKLILSSSQLNDAGRNMPRSCLEAFWQNLMYDRTTSEWKEIIPGSGNEGSMPARVETKMGYGHLDFELRRMESPTAQENEENEENAEPERKRIGDEQMIIAQAAYAEPVSGIAQGNKRNEEAERKTTIGDEQMIIAQAAYAELVVGIAQGNKHNKEAELVVGIAQGNKHNEEAERKKTIGDEQMIIAQAAYAEPVVGIAQGNKRNEEAERKKTIGDEPMIIMDLEQHVIRSVTALKEAGVIFKHKNTPLFWDVKFDLKSGVLEIPQIMIAEWSKSMFLNLMAFELRHIEEKNQKTLSYILFMDSLVNSAADVEELRACGAIVSIGMSDKEVADVFNQLGRNPIVIPFSHQKLFKQIYEYCSKRIHRWRANLMHNYFHNPWAIISVIAAGFLMLLTVLQTCYTIAPYYKSP